MARTLVNIEDSTEQDFYHATANAVLASVQVCAPQVMWVLLRLKFVRSSRDTISVNSLKRDQVCHKLLPFSMLQSVAESNPTASAFGPGTSPDSQMGRRLAFSVLLKQQHALFQGEPQLTFFGLLYCYKISKTPAPRSDCSKRKRTASSKKNAPKA